MSDDPTTGEEQEKPEADALEQRRLVDDDVPDPPPDAEPPDDAERPVDRD